MWYSPPNPKRSKVVNPLIQCFSHAPGFWERRGFLAWILWPLSLLYRLISAIRFSLYELGILKSYALNVPLIIVGNIRVGGTGKTPTVLALAHRLVAAGFKPGIISRGYKAQIDKPTEVNSGSKATEVGDEPSLLATELKPFNVPVWVYHDRVATAKALLAHHPEVNVIISDDGLQHYRLKRWPAREGGQDIEIVLRDERQEGNEFILPAGPLRESVWRARDFTISMNSTSHPETYVSESPNFTLTATVQDAYQLKNPSQKVNLLDFSGREILAAAGLGNPNKFFNLLKSNGLKIRTLPLPDHYDFSVNPFENRQEEVILITQKDAVKCQLRDDFVNDARIWVVPVSIELPNDFISLMINILRRPPHH